MFQSFDFTVVQRPGKQNVIPDMLSRLFDFQEQELRCMPVALAPLCGNIPGTPELHATKTGKQYRLSMDNLHYLQPVRTDRDFFTDELHTIATVVFSTIDPARFKIEQGLEYKAYLSYLRSETTELPPRETIGSMSHFYLHDDLLYRSCVPRHLRTRKQFRD